ncbi:RadC family protein [Paenibacillus sp. YN15]|uniref:JAB domain-containing protein n=1 Tax=Paenibacillus sp. YN15 TaxID=1742774 RepID=UPI000DCC896E|nr:JAB domain-containing protein [Paenibacillus sp. YN15]RAV02691.1 hypothetical protein DQG13_09315 [Paenibacillus sp. YN15]
MQLLFFRISTVQELLELTQEEIIECDIRPAKAKQIMSVLRLGKYLATPPASTRIIIKNPDDAYEVLKPHLLYRPNEKMVLIGLGTKNNVVFTEVISSGTLNSCLLTPLLVLRPLIKRNCTGGILGHVHPSGDCTPSPEDVLVTKTIMDAASACSLEITDHLILGDNCYVSLRQKGLI